MDPVLTRSPLREIPSVAELGNGTIQTYTIRCDTFGIAPAQPADLAGGDAQTECPYHPRYPAGRAGCSTGYRAHECRSCTFMSGGWHGIFMKGSGLLPSSIDSGKCICPARCACGCNAGCGMILDEIIRRTEKRVARLPASFPENNTRAHVSLIDAIRNRNGRNAIIAEIKCASPSRGIIRRNVDMAMMAGALAGKRMRCTLGPDRTVFLRGHWAGYRPR